MAPAAYQAMRGASFLVAVTFAAEIGDVRRFDTPRKLMSFLGLVPAQSSTGDTVRRKGLTLAGNRRARRALVEAAWTYRYPARVSETLRARIEDLPKPVRDIAWKAQLRCVPGIVGSALLARSCLWWSPPLLARWQHFCGPSVVRSRPCSGAVFLAAQRRGWGHGGGNSRR
jgi:Transposase IS116/IS110/IS902 family